MKKAFTLAEIMIVLTVIGVLTCILLPSAFHSMPDENIMKFKKANVTLFRVINELVSSDKYYLNGDLGVKPNGDLIDGTHTGDYTYFCETIADILSVKSVNCVSVNSTKRGFAWLNNNQELNNLNSVKPAFDSQCKDIQNTMGNEIISTDGVTYFQVNSNIPFGISTRVAGVAVQADEDDLSFDTDARLFSSHHHDDNGFDAEYKIFCIDVDEINNGEDPFGYGIRADGKILTGARADEWIKKSIQQNE